MDVGSNCRLGVCFLHLIRFWLYVYLSLVLSLVDLFIDLVDLFFYIYIYFPFSLFVSVYVYASLCDFVCIDLFPPFVLGFCLSDFFFF